MVLGYVFDRYLDRKLCSRSSRVDPSGVPCPPPPVHQDDQAYAQYGWCYGMSKLGVAFARLRTQDDRHLFTLKRPTDNELACLEFETEVVDRDQMHEPSSTWASIPPSAS